MSLFARLIPIPVVLGACIFFGTKYRPVFRLDVTDLRVSGDVRPFNGNAVEDDLLSLQWQFPRQKVVATIVNKSTTALTIDWSRAVFTDFHGRVQQFRDISTEKHRPKLETIIQPGERAVEVVYPARYFDRRGWLNWLQPGMTVSQRPRDIERFGQRYVGTQARIDLPVRRPDGTMRTYSFTLTATDFTVEKVVGS